MLQKDFQYVSDVPSARSKRPSSRARRNPKCNQHHADNDQRQSGQTYSRETDFKRSKFTCPRHQATGHSVCRQHIAQTEKSRLVESPPILSKQSSKPIPGGYSSPPPSRSMKMNESTPIHVRRQCSGSPCCSQSKQSSRKKSPRVTDIQTTQPSSKTTSRNRQQGSSLLSWGISKLKSMFRKEEARCQPQPARQPKTTIHTKQPSPPNTPYSRRSSIRSIEELPLNEPMDAETISQVTQSFHQIFSHIPHAVYGLSALALHGYNPRRRLPRTVHVLCPEHTRQTILHWAAIKQLTRLSPVTRGGRDHWGEDDNGYSVYSTEFHGGGNIEGDDLVLAVAIPDGSLRRVRIVFEDQDEFSRLTTVACHRTATSPQVLSLPAIVTRIVLGYHKSLTDGASYNTQKVMRDGLFWVLDQIINSPPNDKVKLDGTWKTNLSSWVFLVPFTASFPEAKPLLEQAGIEVNTQGFQTTRVLSASNIEGI